MARKVEHGVALSERDRRRLPKYHPSSSPNEFMNKAGKRIQHASAVSEAKDFFKAFDPNKAKDMTDAEFRSAVMQALYYMSKGLANIENLVYDNLGDPYKPTEE